MVPYTEETDIIIDNYRYLGNGKWYADITAVIHDHWGLDKNDALKFQNKPVVGDGFAAWWLLQHTRGYQPFVTTVIAKKRIHN